MTRKTAVLLMQITLAVVLLVSVFRAAASATDIDACKYLVITDFTSDPYGIAEELRAQGRAGGFTEISNVRELTEEDRPKACVMGGRWSAEGMGGNVSVRVMDAIGGNLLGEAAASGTAWWSATRTVRGVVKKLFQQLGYTGYNEAVFRAHMLRVYPPRPQLTVSEAQIRATEQRNVLEGIWTDPENKYRFGIVKAPEGTPADYVAVVLQSGSPIWQPNEIKAEIRTTASSRVFTCTYFMGNKKPAGTTLLLENDAELKGSISKAAACVALVTAW